MQEWFHKQYRVEDRGYKTPCWVWKLSTSTSGYGKFSFNNQYYKAHVWIWEFLNGKKPKGYDLHHECELRICVNPEHLELLTRKEHIRKSPKHIMTARIQNKIQCDIKKECEEFISKYKLLGK